MIETASIDELIFTGLAIIGMGLHLLLVIYRTNDLWALHGYDRSYRLMRLVAGLSLLSNVVYFMLQTFFLSLGLHVLSTPNNDRTGFSAYIAYSLIGLEILLDVIALADVYLKNRIYRYLLRRRDSKLKRGKQNGPT